MVRRVAVGWLILGLAACAVRAESGPELTWESDWKAAQKRAAQEMRPVLIDFAADWCGPCRKMDLEFWPRPEVRALADRFVRVRADYDTATVLRQRYGIHSIPNVLVLDPWGSRLGQLVGWGEGADRHLLLLRAVPADFASLAADARAAAEGRADGLAYERLGEAYFPGVLAGASRDYFEKAVKTRELKADPPRLARALAKLGWCGLKLDDPAVARKWFEKSLDVKTARSDIALAGLAVTYARQGKADRAKVLLDELRASYPGSELLTVAIREMERPP
ncbi:MAG TPA: thioredoxin family protein [Candidatus Polarisedimenticolaceae bacterium]|nr:thioredoxin family protein [Candidatus Polarisedimenticolaceae bacterium]